jgi:hypothetical protein
MQQQQTLQPSASQTPEYSLEKTLLLPAPASATTKSIYNQRRTLIITRPKQRLPEAAALGRDG